MMLSGRGGFPSKRLADAVPTVGACSSGSPSSPQSSSQPCSSSSHSSAPSSIASASCGPARTSLCWKSVLTMESSTCVQTRMASFFSEDGFSLWSLFPRVWSLFPMCLKWIMDPSAVVTRNQPCGTLSTVASCRRATANKSLVFCSRYHSSRSSSCSGSCTVASSPTLPRCLSLTNRNISRKGAAPVPTSSNNICMSLKLILVSSATCS
mmetsp:Transcript_39520/g.104280  ORF Transcript_39520/g.104280 Transcript_39520/m.104280 type:complete len:209 (-) Transcript_39520:175-801(-)